VTKKSKKKVRLWIECPTCSGHGEIPLPEILAKPLEVIGRHDGIDTLSLLLEYGFAYGGEDYGEAIKPTAMNNRLVRLLEYGFVTRTRRGKLWVWRKA
jgi:hypothetical protein